MTMSAKSSAAALAVAALTAGCGEAEPPADAAGSVDRQAAPTVAISDESGPLAAQAVGAAFWRHPRFPHLSSIAVVSDGAALSLFNMESEQLDSLAGPFRIGVDIRYLPETASTDALLAAYNAASQAVEFFTVSQDGQHLEALDGEAHLGEIAAFCLWQTPASRAVSLLSVDLAGALSRRELTAGFPGAISASDPVLIAAAGPAAGLAEAESCVVDDENGVAYFATPAAIIRIPVGENSEAGAADVFLSARRMSAPVDFALVGASTDGYAIMTAGAAGYAEIWSLGTGERIGGVTFRASGESDAVETFSTMIATGGNFGGLYRNGLILLGEPIDDSGAPNFKLAPWNGIANALGLEIAALSSPRETHAEARAREAEADDGGLTTAIDPLRGLSIGDDDGEKP